MTVYQLALTAILDFFPLSKAVTMRQTDSTAHKLKPRLFHKSAYLWVHSMDFHSGVNHIWQYYQTPKSAVTSEQFCLLNPLLQFCLQFNFTICTSSPKMAFSCYNSSTLVLLLGTLFNTILHFSDQMAYLPNAPQGSRRIHQRGWLSPRSPSSTIQPSQTVLPVPGPSIVPVDNDPN